MIALLVDQDRERQEQTLRALHAAAPEIDVYSVEELPSAVEDASTDLDVVLLRVAGDGDLAWLRAHVLDESAEPVIAICASDADAVAARAAGAVASVAESEDVASSIASLLRAADRGLVVDPDRADPARLAVALVRRRLARARATSARLEASLRLREEALRAVSQGVITTDAKLVVTYVNEVIERVSGFAFDEIVGKPLDALPGPQPGEREAMRATLLAGEPYEARIVTERKDGTAFWNEVLMSPARDAAGVVTHFVGTMRDVTPRKQREAQLVQSEAMFREAQSLARIGSWRATIPRGETWWSDEMYRIFRIDPEQTKGDIQDLLLAMVHPDDRERVVAAIGRGVATPSDFVEDFRVIRGDGTTVWITTAVKVITNKDGRAVGLRGASQDITERVTADLASRQSERNLMSIADNATIGIMVVQDARVLFANEQAASLGGFRREQVEGRSVSSLARAVRDGGDFLEKVAQSRGRMPVPAQFEIQVETATGRMLPCEVNLATGVWNGRPAIVVFFSDITVRQQTAAALLQAQKMQAVGQLTGGIAHDFNNILAIILSFGGFVRDALPVGGPAHEDMLEVLRAAGRAGDLTRQLLAFSDRHVSQKRPVDLGVLVNDFLKTLRRSVGENITLSFTAPALPAVVKMDPIHLDQILLNLALNARDAMPNGGTLRLTLTRTEPTAAGAAARIRLEVADSGVGMDAATMSRAFDPFFTTKPMGSGSGLGLSTCYALVKDGGGVIASESEVGVGTTFTIDLPECVEVSEAATGNAAEPQGAHGSAVLVIEDDAPLRKAAVRIFESAGFHVLQAADGDDAIQQLKVHGNMVDLVVSDVVMPGSSGYAVASYVRANLPKVAMLLTSGYLDGRAVVDGEPVDGPLLWKPYTSTDLLRAGADALSAHRAKVQMAKSTATAVEPKVGVVMVVEDEEAILSALERVLTHAGHQVLTASTVTSAVAALADAHTVDGILCDMTLPDGSGVEVLTWIHANRPALLERTVVLTGGVLDDDSLQRVEVLGVEVLRKSMPPAKLLERVGRLVAGGADNRAAVVEERVVHEAPERGADEAKVLLVDDDDALLGAYSRALHLAGFTVQTATSGEGALALLAEGRFDAVITDIGLPGADGLEILRAARARDADMPVLLITGAPSVETATLAVRSRAVGYLTKPFSLPSLVQEVRVAVESGQVARLQRKLVAAQAGAGEFLVDLPATRRAFESALRGLFMVFQPIVSTTDGAIFGYEALMRSDHPTLGTPDRLIAASDVLDRTEDLGRAVRRAVANALAEHPERQESIFVNLHPSEVRSDLLCASNEPLLACASRVVLEVTERASLTMGAELTEHVRVLRKAGYRIAIDDLGEGYAGLTWLAQLKPEIAKIDMSLVRGACVSPLKREILESLILVCRRAGILVVAEGIETIEEATLLTDLGCDLLQGYYFARPGAPFPVVKVSIPAPGRAP